MRYLLHLIYSVTAYIFTGLVFLIIGVPIVVLLFVVPERKRYDNRVYFWLTHQFYFWILKATLLPITFVGKHNIPRDQAVVFVANHQSSLDVPLLGYLTNKHPHVWLAWFALARNPFLGFVLRRMAVLVDTTSPQRATRSLVQAINRIKDNNHHVMIFPEGGRFADGRVHDFFSGFVILARRTARPVVPVYIQDAYKVYPADAWLARWHRIKVVVGAPMYSTEGESDEAFKQRVYAWFRMQQEK